MTEAEWLACADLRRMLNWLHNKASRRKMRLFACACCRRLWPLMTDPRSREAVEVAERYAEGKESHERLTLAKGAARQAYENRSHGTGGAHATAAAFYAARGPVRLAARDVAWATTADVIPTFGPHEAAALLRDIIGNPFRPSSPLPPAVFAWNDKTVGRLAQVIYDEQQMPEGRMDAARLAILADALLDAGCDNEDLIQHCRSDGPHVRGCWAVDLILGKS